jgi:hypothetical protein
VKNPITLGFLVSSLGRSQMAYHLLHEGSVRLGPERGLDVVVFQQNMDVTWATPTFAVMNICEAYDFRGVAVATDVATARSLTRFPGPSGRLFYVWDLEWMRGEPADYDALAAAYRDERVSLVARSPSHARLIEECWNRAPCGIAENFNLLSLAELGRRSP